MAESNTSDTTGTPTSQQSKDKKRSLWASPIVREKNAVYARFRGSIGHFDIQRNVMTYALVNRILDACQRQKGPTPIKGKPPVLIDVTEAIWLSKQSLADEHSVSLKAVQKAEARGIELGLLVSDGYKGCKSRRLALGQNMISFLTGVVADPMPSIRPNKSNTPVGGNSNTPVGGNSIKSNTPVGGYRIVKAMNKKDRIDKPGPTLPTHSLVSEQKTLARSPERPYKEFNRLTGWMPYAEKNKLLDPIFDRFGNSATVDRVRFMERKYFFGKPGEKGSAGKSILPLEEIAKYFIELKKK